jgi:hypothetical protein
MPRSGVTETLSDAESVRVVHGIREQTHDIDVFALLSAIFVALTSIGLV